MKPDELELIGNSYKQLGGLGEYFPVESKDQVENIDRPKIDLKSRLTNLLKDLATILPSALYDFLFPLSPSHRRAVWPLSRYFGYEML